ncbi:peptidase G2 autoproteolytic cleavage domain-containing protein [Lachnospiraceae bacterium 66-29]
MIQKINFKKRREWDYVGMLGVLPVRNDGTCQPGQFCKCGKDGIATLTKVRGFDTYMVLERISENIVSVILK